MGPVADTTLPFAVDLSDASGHLAHALHEQLRAAILDGRLVAGAALPSSRSLAATLGIARNTVVGAYDLLVAEGYVLPRRGAKAVVADVRPRPSTRPAPRSIEDPRLAPLWRTPYLPFTTAREVPARSFRLGVPDHRHFPHAIWRRLNAQVLQRWSKTPFAYPPSEGIRELREAIATHVAFARAVACSADDVVVTSGAQQAFDLLARLLVTPGKTRVAVEEPGYPPLRSAFVAAGATLVPIPVDEEGLCVDQLPSDVRIVCVTPSHQSPTGAALSMRRRTALLEFARAHGAVILEDDYDGEYRFGARPLDALQTLDRDGIVFYIGTFSKSLFPGLRKGFVVTPPWAFEPLVAVKSCVDAHSDEVAQAVLAAFIRDGHLARHVRRMRGLYAARRAALLDGLRALSPWLTPIPSEAGMHLAARLRFPEQAAKVFEIARDCTPGATSSAVYAMTPPADPAIAFGYGVIDAEEIARAMARFRQRAERELGQARAENA